MTPHINAPAGAFAETVLFCGDPLRAQFIAHHFLKNAQEITNVRAMLGFTGEYQQHKLSVMGHGMGIPSCSIYAKELITEYGVKNLIRVGSCGAVLDEIKLHDVIIALSAATDSNVNRLRFRHYDFAATADYSIFSALIAAAAQQNITARVGTVFSTDSFYHADTELMDLLKRFHILGVEMEAAGLFGVAAEYGARAGCILTVSDHILRQETTTALERQTRFHDMITIALEAAVRLAH
ncbi:purine-nucleoside phosphorylase [Dichelobacter nodosus]|uniref:Purine nucleoside phosphorylase DeoD-type n=1 Tax=Dichelobacter nodosus (strain VCS1703A) TaxID=246195 RepID=DEOD_DICNV|nr:purine-nucleoside phosphorylase [Dichelobacter nodosus]A5EV41.1 RecName: Full=Purine nucleoside phosphorylase DeoD-type; Short=PNP [Dichelobacter nodosus VCS1703A]ABQ13931.1 purine nucleoside phosphorylase [Dichelobacter nodosus VCS1703A]AXM45564.1 purine-nucleoside phosphorylase [Dichelobacter nodosus]KNZ38952.1 purine nucleoside phosphorylase [Dichelobacter nodosus]TGA66249.1 purine-nucleoside phosphorylase [Dichelobacter nodosus]